ncbi:MAG: ATP-binding protein [Bellilinea sp.]|jgi:PAS domain S-box-containing protein
MEISSLQLPSDAYINLPFQFSGWAGWLGLIGLLLWGFVVIWRSRYYRQQFRWGVLIIAAIALPVAAVLIQIRLPMMNGSALPNIPIEMSQPVIVALLLIPLLFSAGLGGPLASTLIGVVAGIFISLFVSHDIFSIIELGGLGLILGVALRQNYRTRIYKALRHPIAAVAAAWFAFIPIFLLSSFFSIPGTLAERLDFALTQNWQYFLARGVELLIAGVAAQICYLFLPRLWHKPRELLPSPSEESLKARFLIFTLPLAIGLLVLLIIGNWWVAGRAARSMMEARLSGMTRMAAESLPYFLEAGQSLLIDFAQPALLESTPQGLSLSLMDRIRSVPFFRQLRVYDANRNLLGVYPESGAEETQLSADEEIGVDLALKGVLIQVYTVSPFPGERSAQVSFIAAIKNENGEAVGAILGRTDFESNPFTQPALIAMAGVLDEGGEGYILDENRLILYQTSIASPLTAAEQFIGILQPGAGLYEDISATGTRQLLYTEQVIGRPWQVVAKIPASVAQQIALDMAIPMLVILMFLFGLGSLLMFGIVRVVTRNLARLTEQASRISDGHLEQPISSSGVDEVGRLGKSFEQMRISLKNRLDELKKLLTVSQGVAANLEIGDAIQPILNAALNDDAVSARAVMIQETRMDLDGDQLVRIGVGSQTASFDHLDLQIFEQMRSHQILSIPNTARVRRIAPIDGKPHPGAIIAFALYFENTYYGALWMAYDRTHNFAEDEVRFLSTLASEAALAAANSRLYAFAEIGRRRLEAVLASAPEPVLVFDEKDRLLLLNPAAMHIPGLISTAMPGRSLNDVIAVDGLVKLIKGAQEERILSREISLSNGKIYHASVAPVTGEDQQLGKVCVLRDITHYKELDSVKSEFVATVSHDLRTPLTLMRGYTTMLSMVGELNEQQQNYVNKMVSGVENMTHLVNNLLDLGRIEAGISLNLEEIDPAVVVEKILRQHQPQAAQKNIALVFEGSGDGKRMTLIADLALLQQALINLVDNAIKYTRSNGQVTIRLRRGSDRLTFEVHDNGIGIAPLDLPRLFEKFYRSGRREAYEQRGSGLGLAIVRSIVERHQGRVWVESQLGKGSTFFVEIPYTQSPQEQKEAIEESGINLKK